MKRPAKRLSYYPLLKGRAVCRVHLMAVLNRSQLGAFFLLIHFHDGKLHPVVTTGAREIDMAEFTVSRAGIKRGEMAKRSGCNLETIRYYEKVGLLNDPARTEGGHRVYLEADQSRLRFILKSRELGFTTAEVKSLLSLVDEGDYSCSEIHTLTVEHLKSISKKIADLRKLERTLTKISSECSKGANPDCPIIDALVS